VDGWVDRGDGEAMNTFKRKKRELVDRKNAVVYAFWMLVNKILISLRFKDFQIIGRQNLPKSGPFLLVSNHVTRWDGLIVYGLIDRPANFMVSPNELLGMQGAVLSSMGSFPADPRLDLINHAMNVFKKGEGVVVFPEGNIFRDGSTHPFKTGAAKIALAAASAGIDLPIIPVAINYAGQGSVAQIVLGRPVRAGDYLEEATEPNNRVLRSVSDRLHGEVSTLRAGLAGLGERLAQFAGQAGRRFLEVAWLGNNEVVIAGPSHCAVRSQESKVGANIPCSRLAG
jgi:1-acyl-sn-glycerol-3-phosphate acyltransferase